MLRTQILTQIDGAYLLGDELDHVWGLRSNTDSSSRAKLNFVIPANTTDLELSWEPIPGVKEVIFRDRDSSTNITIKLNNETVAFPCSPFLIVNHSVWKIKVTNNSSVNARALEINFATHLSGDPLPGLTDADGTQLTTADGEDIVVI